MMLENSEHNGILSAHEILAFRMCDILWGARWKILAMVISQVTDHTQGSHYKTIDSDQQQPMIVFGQRSVHVSKIDLTGSIRNAANIIDQRFVHIESRRSQLDLERARNIKTNLADPGSLKSFLLARKVR